MTTVEPAKHLEHDHDFHQPNPEGERRTRWVVAITLGTMILEITAGLWTGSMALLADGWHMGTHAGALGITIFAYSFARRHARSPRYAFGTGKVSVLGGYTSAVLLAAVALMMIVESVQRLLSPVRIRFDEALGVAVLGLVVNILSAWILQGGRAGASPHEHGKSERAPHSHHHDHNLRAAYFHVLADALTSVLAIIALLAGRTMGWVWMDPIMGIVGALVITKWSVGLLKDTSRILLDGDVPPETVEEVRRAIEAEPDSRLVDVHIWKVGANEQAAILSIATPLPRRVEHYKELLKDCPAIRHITVEIHPIAPSG